MGGVCLSACWDTPPGQTLPLGKHPQADTPRAGTLLGRHPCRHPPADGTHPIGMHSCFSFKYVILIIFAVILIVKHMNSKLPNRLLKACRLVFFVRSKTE